MTGQIPKPFPAIQLVYASPDLPQLEEEELIKRLQGFDDINQDEKITAAWFQRDSQHCLGELHFGEHIVQINGLAHPLPADIMNRTIHASAWQPQIKAAMRHHQAHLSLVYAGEHHEPIEKYIALYQAAHAFENENLLGILNANAWTAHPTADFLKPHKVNTYRDEAPLMLWIGYVKFFIDKQHYWLATKGHYIFDLPELASFIRVGENKDAVIRNFINIFFYLYEEDVFVTAGDTFSVGEGEQRLQFKEIPEDADFLMGPAGTLVIEKITSEN